MPSYPSGPVGKLILYVYLHRKSSPSHNAIIFEWRHCHTSYEMELKICAPWGPRTGLFHCSAVSEKSQFRLEKLVSPGLLSVTLIYLSGLVGVLFIYEIYTGYLSQKSRRLLFPENNLGFYHKTSYCIMKIIYSSFFTNHLMLRMLKVQYQNIQNSVGRKKWPSTIYILVFISKIFMPIGAIIKHVRIFERW